MIFYSGWGLLVPGIGALGAALAVILNDALGGSVEAVVIGFLLGGVFAAGSSWWLGSKLNHPSRGEIVIDRKTGARRERRPDNSFMFIPFQYYAFIYALIFGACLIGGVVNYGSNESSRQRHSMNAPHTGLASFFAMLAGGKAEAADSRAVLTWRFSEDKSALNDQVTPKADSSATFQDGIRVEAQAACESGNVDIEFATFRGDGGVKFDGEGNTISLRLRFNDQTDRTASAVRDYANAAIILFYDPDAARQAVHKAVPSGMFGGGANLAQALFGSIGMAQIQASAAGTIADLLGASSIRVELPLADGSANVVDLNPRDTSLRQLVQRCVHTEPASTGPANSPSATSDQSASFQQGLSERSAWEKWIASISGSFQQGALFWAEHRSDRPQPSCNDSQGQQANAFSQGCLRARDFLTRADAKRSADAEYRRGWNSY